VTEKAPPPGLRSEAAAKAIPEQSPLSTIQARRSHNSAPPADTISQQLARRRDAANRLPPLRSGYRDPLSRLAHHPSRRRRETPGTVLLLSRSLAVLRGAWVNAEDPGDRDELRRIANYLREVAR
jgi:hypothetical protein